MTRTGVQFYENLLKDKDLTHGTWIPRFFHETCVYRTLSHKNKETNKIRVEGLGYNDNDDRYSFREITPPEKRKYLGGVSVVCEVRQWGPRDVCEIYICLVDMKYFTLLKIEETRGEITRYLFSRGLEREGQGKDTGASWRRDWVVKMFVRRKGKDTRRELIFVLYFYETCPKKDEVFRRHNSGIGCRIWEIFSLNKTDLDDLTLRPTVRLFFRENLNASEFGFLFVERNLRHSFFTGLKTKQKKKIVVLTFHK